MLLIVATYRKLQVESLTVKSKMERSVLGHARSGCGAASAPPGGVERVVRKRCAFCRELTANRPSDRFCWAVVCSEQCLTSYEEWFSEWVAQGRLAQGLPPKLDDPTVLAQIARIIEMPREELKCESAVLCPSRYGGARSVPGCGLRLQRSSMH